MRADVLDGTFLCPACGFRNSGLPVEINRVARIDEDARDAALRTLRFANFAQLLDDCADLLPRGASMLDVGCAHGWFLEAAKSRGLHAAGIEPDDDMAARARASGHDVVHGFFPDALPTGALYDAITFNDVFEHLPDVGAMARVLPGALRPGGVVIVNLPVSDGLVFRLSRQAARLGLRGPLQRMWQVGLPSPHLSYFSAATVPRLFAANGFTLVRSGPLEAVITEGLYERIRYDRAVGPVKAAALYAAARMVKLAVGAFPSDIQYFVFRPAGPPLPA